MTNNLATQDRSNRATESALGAKSARSSAQHELGAISQAIANSALLTAPIGELAILRYLASPQVDAFREISETE